MTSRQRGWLLPPLALFLACGILIGRVSVNVLWGLFGLLLALPACLLLRGRGRFCAIMAFALALGCVLGFRAYHPSLPPEGDYQVSGIIVDDIRTDSNRRVRTTLDSVTLNGEPFSSGAYWSFYTDELPEGLAPGVQVSFTASLYHPSGASNPDGYDFREEQLRRGVTIGVFGMGGLEISPPSSFNLQGWAAALRSRLSKRLIQELGEEAGGYASTMLLGSRSLIAREDRSAFSRLGIAHVLSVSGFHVGVLVSVFALLFRLLHMRQGLRLAFYVLLLGAYSAVCGFSQPVIRASLLIILGLVGRIQARPRSSLHLLCAAFTLMLIFSPVQLTGLSFQLSFGAVLGISLITPYLSTLWRPSNSLLQRVWSGLTAGIGAQLGILLPELYTFQELPLAGLIINIPMLAVASALILLYWAVLVTLPLPFLSPLLCRLASAVTSFLISAIRFLGDLPGITLWTRASDGFTAVGVVLMFIALCGLLRLKGRTRLILGGTAALIITLSLLPRPHLATEYIQFSVGNADAAVLWDRDRVIVIDTGYDDGAVSDFLHRRRLTPDAVILTHLHTDHAGGLTALLEDRIPIALCCIPTGGEDAQIHPDILALINQLRADGTEVRSLSSGDIISLPSGSIEVIWPEEGKVRPNQDANESSLVMRIDLNGTSLLQTGDLDGRYEMYAAAPSDILKIAHHGSVNSSSPEFLSSVSPDAVLLSTGRNDRRGKVINRLGDETPVYSTANSGALTVRFYPGSYMIETFLPPEMEPANIEAPEGEAGYENQDNSDTSSPSAP